MDYLIFNLSELDSTAVDLSSLCAQERTQAEHRGLRYARIRALLRHEIARRAQIRPETVAFSYGPHGKPECELQPFNISHSGDCLCLAFHQLAVGVDVEWVRPRQFEPLARRFMEAGQLEAFKERGCRQEEFFACWCAAEALVKHAGDTMWNARNYPFRFIHGHIECLFDHAPELHLFTPMPGYQGAIAYTPLHS